MEDAVEAEGWEVRRTRAPGGPREQQQMEVRELIEEIVKALVDNPDQVQCVEIQGTQSCVSSYTLPRGTWVR